MSLFTIMIYSKNPEKIYNMMFIIKKGDTGRFFLSKKCNNILLKYFIPYITWQLKAKKKKKKKVWIFTIKKNQTTKFTLGFL